MAFKDLPIIKHVEPLDISHFPSRFHAAVFRLWETVPAKRLAAAFDTTEEVIQSAACAMGLPPQPNLDIWDKRGYITTIRNAWHLLPYEQMLKILEWTPKQLAVAIKEEDFLFVKLGYFKPYCEPIHPEPLDEAQTQCLERLRNTVLAHFTGLFSGPKPFDFFSNADNVQPAPASDELRLIYSYCGLYANVLEQDIDLSYPDSLLKMYQSVGVNAVWLPVVLYQMVPFPFGEEYSVGWESRQARLRELVEKAGKYNIKVYIYLNEPRNMPISFFDKHPELMGRRDGQYAALCTEKPGVLEYLRYAVRTLCQSVPGIGGFFTITMSEYLTHCKSRPEGIPCPVCENVPTQKLVADVLCAIYEEAKAVDPNIGITAWAWAWDREMTKEEVRDCLDRLPKDIVIQNNSESQKTFVIGGVEGFIQDYSMSIPGPSEHTKAFWEDAKERGHEICAKVQLNVTWECSTLPYLPVFDLVREHMINLRQAGIKHLQMSWTLGGYPSINLKVATRSFDDPSEEAYRKLLQEEFGEQAETVARAATLFSDAFREFPFHIDSLYFGPQNAGPSNLLYAEPTGYEATMTCYSYDDLDKWRGIYPREVYTDQWRKVSEKWKLGLEELKDMPDCEFKQMALGGYCLFRASYLQAAFVMARDAGDKVQMKAIVQEEKAVAMLMYELMCKNQLFGYEAANHYYFTRSMMAEKVLNCENLLRQFD